MGSVPPLNLPPAPKKPPRAPLIVPSNHMIETSETEEREIVICQNRIGSWFTFNNHIVN